VDEVAIFTNALSATAVQQIYQAASSVPSVLPSFVNWLYPTPIIYGQQLGLGQLNATSLAPGTFAYDPTLAAGSNTLYLTFNPYDAADFSGETTNVPILVLPAPLTVTANDATNSYGAANPVLTGSISGLVNGDNITAAFSSGTGPGSQIGAYPIVPALLDPANRLDNYNVTTNLGVLTITPVPLTVTAYNATQIYGAASPAFTGSISGLVNNDYIAPIFSSAASAGSQPGSYPIAPTLLDPDNRLVNYVVTTNFGVFTIISTNPPPFSQAYSQGPLLITTLTGLLPGELVVVQSSTDLSTWTTIQTNTATGANLSITNLINPSGVMQFFRAAVQ
jgi:hypothetical protein